MNRVAAVLTKFARLKQLSESHLELVLNTLCVEASADKIGAIVSFDVWLCEVSIFNKSLNKVAKFFVLGDHVLDFENSAAHDAAFF